MAIDKTVNGLTLSLRLNNAWRINHTILLKNKFAGKEKLRQNRQAIKSALPI